MAEPHVIAHFAVPLALTIWWTKSWLMDPITQRWRFAVSALAGTLMWIYLAYTATRAAEASGGVQIVYGSTALAYVCAFMAMTSFVGIILGLLLWTEEEGLTAAGEITDAAGDYVPGAGSR